MTDLGHSPPNDQQNVLFAANMYSITKAMLPFVLRISFMGATLRDLSNFRDRKKTHLFLSQKKFMLILKLMCEIKVWKIYFLILFWLGQADTNS